MNTGYKVTAALGLAISGYLFSSSPSFATLLDQRIGENEIVVTGNKSTRDVIAEFIDTTLATPKGGKYVGQIARFSQAICPKVVGLSAQNKLQIEQRIRGVAKASDIKVADKGCKPNIFVIIVSDGNEAVSILRKKRSRLFGDMPQYERDRIANSEGPTYSWKRIVTANAESGAVQNSDDAETVPGSEIVVPIMYSTVTSNVKRTIRKDMSHSFLLLEKDALVGLTTLQIGDYAAMRSLIDTKASAANPAPEFSILSLFESVKSRLAKPKSVSEWDLVLLSSLYNSPADISAAQQSSAMLHRFENEITEIEGETGKP